MYTKKSKIDRPDYNPKFDHPMNKIKGDIKMEPFPRITVEVVDRLVEIAKKNGSKDVVQTSKDWDTIAKMYEVFRVFFPKTEAAFVEGIQDFRKRENAHGIGKEGGAAVQHQLEVPMPLFQMIETIFPQQKWDKKFVKGIAQVLPQLKPINDNY